MPKIQSDILFSGDQNETVSDPPKTGGQTADEIIQKQLNLKPKDRNISLFENASEAHLAVNSVNADIVKQAAESGMATNNLEVVPEVDAEGRFTGRVIIK